MVYAQSPLDVRQAISAHGYCEAPVVILDALKPRYELRPMRRVAVVQLDGVLRRVYPVGRDGRETDAVVIDDDRLGSGIRRGPREDADEDSKITCKIGPRSITH